MNGVQRFLRPGWVVGHVLVLIAALICFRLAWWQLDRSEEADGTLQNVGYALLWPAFGVAFVYMWMKFIRLERERSAQERQDHQQSLELMLAEAESLTVQAAGVATVTASQPPDDDTESRSAGTMDSPAQAHQLSGPAGPQRITDDDSNDPELAAYNRALAALAEKDRRAR